MTGRGDASGAAGAAGFRSASNLARMLQVLFAAWMVLSGLAIASSYIEYRLIADLLDNPLSVTVAEVNESADRQRLIGFAQIGGSVVVGLAFIVWLRRLYGNLRVLSGPTRFGTGWAIGAWFVPFLNLLRPKQIVDEIWTESGSTDEGVSPLVHVWWGMWIASGLLGQFLFRSTNTSDLERAETLALGVIAADVVEAITAVLAFWLVTLMTRRQEDHARRVLGAEVSAFEELSTLSDLSAGGRRTPTVAVAVLPAVAAIVAVVAFVAWDGSDSGSGAASSSSGGGGRDSVTGEGVLLFELEVGDCFLEPDSSIGGMVLAVQTVPCEQPHFAEVYHRTELTDGGRTYPGDLQMAANAFEVCFAEFDSFVGEPYAVSPLDFVYIHPDQFGWRGGQRHVICSVYRLSGANLVGSARGIGRP